MNKNWLLKGLSILGPGIVTAALVFGPSKMTITSKMGADYGFELIWVIFLAIFFMLIFTNMSARIGQYNTDSLLTLIRKKIGKFGSVFIGAGIFLVAISFQAGNSTGVGIAMGEATGTDAKIWIVVFNLAGILLLFFRSFYQVLEKVMLGLVILMLISFLVTLILIQPSLNHIADGLVPHIPTGSTGLIVAFIASCFSLVGAFYQSYLVQEKRKSNPEGNSEDKHAQLSSTIGILILGLMSAVVLICAASVLHTKGMKVNSASEMAMALEPLFGSKASLLFLIGLFGASFSSLIGNATLGGSMLGDALGLKGNLNNNYVKILIAVVMVFGAIISLLFSSLPLELIVLAQSVTIFLVPFTGIAIYWIANSEDIMGEHKNNLFQKIVGLLGILLVIGLAVLNFKVLVLS
ncbi:divalent metal cation transporter [Sphingobacterium sp. DK4209]|uniref:Divalent metal cation transporter n=1 Tax=Sphingobacterium zhuxiongii TaxID=2662364 RepID=A0A5Q0QH65_9SPHI|nr:MULTISPECIES: Nramp family divalent metal transporter [unclassified Sphingobacterium]MVZ64752.1 divalent metal cation transporter [Sphingobacterium sp. DK4209]QGA27082.1 divalent metal cation transporter [Sphingobacterium sp. dk4302]